LMLFFDGRCSHFGLFDLEAAIADLRKFYSGPLVVGADMQCTPVQ
jgi:hypothetical protein